MFGYVVANLDKLTPDEKARYQACYCGLCRALGQRYNTACRLTLTYDMTFLIILLSSLNKEEIVTEGFFRCPLHPMHKRPFFHGAYTGYAADLNLVLAYYQHMDDWQDDRRTSSLFQGKALGRHLESVRKCFPRQCAAIEDGLKSLALFEQQNETNPDLPAASFGQLLGEVFVPDGHPHEETLRSFGNKLGRFIYIMDAAVDLKKDIRKEKYNPLVSIPSEMHEDILQMMMADCMASFNQLPVLQDKGLMENILYSGVWTRYRTSHKGDLRA